jgi:hypothetical protein
MGGGVGEPFLTAFAPYRAEVVMLTRLYSWLALRQP